MYEKKLLHATLNRKIQPVEMQTNVGSRGSLFKLFWVDCCTVLVLIKLTKFAVALRLRCGSCKLIFDIISSLFC